MISILGKAKSDGFVAGWGACRQAMSNTADVAYHDGYSRGYAEAVRIAPRRFRWFCIGALTIALSFIPGWFV